jgi:tRNA pseudouridine55 synthase
MPHVPPEPLSGFVLNVYKEVPWTSHDAVSRLRRILGLRQVGHAGSLDPFACGVLVVAVGRATRLVEYLMAPRKSYRGTMMLGRRTASGDAGGAILEEVPAPEVDLDSLRRAAAGFVGSGLQVPPMVSAIKHQGKRLYDLARKGIEVERAPRPIQIDRFEITGLESPRVDFELDCGRGTYVRTLVEDFAAKFGAPASVESLTRTAVGSFRVEDAVRIISSPGNTREGLLAGAVSMAEALEHLPAVQLTERWAQRVRHGGAPPWRAAAETAPPRPGQAVRLLGPGGELIATAVVDLLPGPADRPIEESCHLRLDRVL